MTTLTFSESASTSLDSANFPSDPQLSSQFRLALEAAPTGMILVDRNGCIALVNSQVEKLFGYARAELIGQPIEMLVPERFRKRHPDYRAGFFADSKTRSMGGGRDLYGLRKDGSEVPIEIGLNPLRTPQNEFVLSSVVDITERKHSADQFRLALEAAPTGMMMVDSEGRIVLVNAQVEKLFGYAREELIGEPIEKLVPERFRAHHPGFRNNFYHQPEARPMGGGRDLFGLRKDGSEMPIEIGLNPLRTAQGTFVLSSIVDITERKRLESALRQQLRERDVLLQEVHHRVKNNLQVISSLISLQRNSVGDDRSHSALDECATRVQAIALIHEQLYQARDFSSVPFYEYTHNLAATIFRTSGTSLDAVRLQLEIEPISVAVDTAIPCGLILSELITNSLKHAFPNGRTGTLRVALTSDSDGERALTVADDGVGLPEKFDPNSCQSLGMHLIHSLTDQIRGRFEYASDNGATFTLYFRDSQ
jgi:PAS domain S-box-containing protein